MKVIYKRRTVKAKYGLTLEQYDAIVSGPCAICGCKPDKPHLDHCHRTGRMRGVLCRKCNLGLGMFKDDVETLKAAVRYLESSRSRR